MTKAFIIVTAAVYGAAAAAWLWLLSAKETCRVCLPPDGEIVWSNP